MAEQIDMLINLNKEDTEFFDIDLDEVLEDSLAYYLGDKETKKGVKGSLLFDIIIYGMLCLMMNMTSICILGYHSQTIMS